MSRILVAEDEPALLDCYAELIESLGHEVVRALDGEEALTIARGEHPDLVVTDYMMPNRSGIDVIRALRADPVLARVPVILLSAGRPAASERKEAWLFLSKPVSLERLEAAVREALAAAFSQGAPVGFRARPDETVSPLSLVREEMLGWVSHEIKSPLSAAMAAVQLATRGLDLAEPPETMLKRLKAIQRQLVRMDELVESLLDAAQLQDGKLALDRQIVDLRSVLTDAVATWRDVHPDVELVLADVPRVELDADPARVRQIFDNLISNGIKYGRPTNKVEIAVTVDLTTAQVAVTDYGLGIARDQIPRLFDRFHRVPGQGGRGHGLGLYIAAALARLHGGTIDVASQVGAGSTFTVTLPRAPGGA